MKTKLYIIVIAFLAGLFTVHGEQDIPKIWDDPEPLLSKIRSQIDNKDMTYEEEKTLTHDIQNLAYAISEELGMANSPDWANPSSERKAVIRKWAKILEPETQKLVDLAFGKGFSKDRSARQARSLLDYAPATPKFAEQVRKYIANDSLSGAFSAADLLYEHRLLTDADKEALRKMRPLEDEKYNLESWAAGMAALGNHDGLEIIKKALSQKPHGDTPEEISDPYLKFLFILYDLGPEAATLLPEIEALIADPAIISSGCLNHFEYARDVIRGKEQRTIRNAVNGSGHLSSWLLDEELKKSEPNVSLPEQSLGLKKTTGQIPTPQNPNPQKTNPEQVAPAVESTIFSGWPVYVVVIPILLGLLWMLIKKR